MRHQKKVLALVLAFACAFTMFAGAAFTDQADIKDANAEAVDMLVALGVLKGYTDGSFQPDATVTRAEMAKMIYVLRTGNDNADAYKASATKFTDLNTSKSAWAAGFIKYCEAMGIIAGKSATKFDPDNTVTGEEAAKMLLVTLGYNAEQAGLVGKGWAQHATALADENGLLKDVNTPLSQALPRQYAAQIMYNAVNADVVTLKDGQYEKKTYTTSEIVGKDSDNDGVDDFWVSQTVTKNETLGKKYLGLNTIEGIVTATGHNVKGYTASLGGTISFTKMGEDLAPYMAQKIKVLYKDTDDVFGVYVTGDSDLVVETTVNGLDKISATANTFKADSVEYKTETAKSEDLPVKDAMGNAIASISTMKDLTSANITLGSKVVLVDNNGNDKVDVAIVTPIKASKVNYVSSDKATLVAPEGTSASAALNTLGFAGSVDFDDADVYDGIAKNDYAAYVDGAYTSTGDPVVTKIDVVSGKISGVKGSAPVTEVKIGSDWYKTTQVAGVTFKNGNNMDLFIINGVAYGAKTTSAVASTSSFLVVQGLSNDYGDVRAKVLLGDGKTQEITIGKVSIDGSTYYDASYTSGTVLNYNDGAAKTIETNNALFTYKIVDDKYRLTPVAGSVDAESVLGYDGFENSKEYTDKEIDGNPISDDAVVFVRSGTGNNDYKTITGKAAKAWGTSVTSSNSDVAAYIYNNENGYKYVKVAYVTMSIEDPGASDDKVYGYIVSAPYESELANGDAATALTIWNGTETIDVLDKNKTTGLDKGDFISYTDQGEGVIKAEKVLDYGTDEKQIFAFDGGKNLQFASKDSVGTTSDVQVDSTNKFLITDDTTILYIDSDKVEGVSGGSIQIANKDAAGKLLGDNNAYFVSKATKNSDGKVELKLLVVEIANDIK
ncbi:S-layer homology domain-containing protein [Agathobaculum sp.]|uniref:S-layer homology domain-containing protein n=1 Tax=Agathobaculum sp. TaxID=2048138 RepID=UPI002A827F0B|nr:S-layer homology domain-containing protein [Agathobaculum sp.]MDY3617396.1 S-layer homology domain-containing protein [Agathobaculum sp.]